MSITDPPTICAADSKNSGFFDDFETGGWKNTLSNAAMGVAGAATAASLGALAFYAYHKLGADVSMIVDPQSIQGIGEYGAEHIRSAIRGLGQIDRFMSSLNASGNVSTMGDFFDQMQSSGVDPEVFKSAVASHVDLLGVKNAGEWAQKLTNPATILTPAVQARVTELVWYHDKQVAIHAQGAQDAAVFVKTGLAITLAGVTSSLVDSVEKMKELTHHMLRAARRVAVKNGLVSVREDQQIRKTIQDTAFDPTQARARLALEYTERQTPMNRFVTLHWLEASRSEDRACMLALFALESRSIGKHTAIGQAVMIDHFAASELGDLASRETVHSKALNELAQRRSALETQGVRAGKSTGHGDRDAQELFDSTIDQILEASVHHGVFERKKSCAPSIR